MIAFGQWLADKQAQIVGAVGATLNALILLRVVTLDGEQVSGLNLAIGAWLAVLVTDKKTAGANVVVAEKQAHTAGFDQAVVELASLAAPPPTKQVAKKAAARKR